MLALVTLNAPDFTVWATLANYRHLNTQQGRTLQIAPNCRRFVILGREKGDADAGQGDDPLQEA
jgi:hypothetical protein